MKFMKSFLLSGVLAAGIAAAGFMGTANAQPVSMTVGDSTITMDSPSAITELGTMSFNTSENNKSVKFSSVVYQAKDINSDPLVFSMGMRFDMDKETAKGFKTEDLINDPEFLKSITNSMLDEFKRQGIKVSDISFKDDTLNGYNVKKSVADMSIGDQKNQMVIVLLAKEGAVWMVGAASADNASVEALINSVK